MNVAKIKTGIVEPNTYFLSNDNNDCIVIDPGDDIPGIMNYLTDNNLRPLYVLLTHAHFDHCNAARALQMNGAKIYMHKKDYPLVKSDDNLASKFGVLFNKFTPDGFVKDNQHLNIADSDILVLHTPGHTAGSCCYLIDNFMFSGDTLMYLTCGRTDFPSGNKKEMKQSLSRLMNLQGNYVVFPGHNAATNLDFERKNNPYV